MSIMGLLQPGAVQVVNPKSRKVIGYAFSVETQRGQLQRWLLFEHPHNTLDIEPPPEHMAQWSLSDWQANVAELWRPGSFYVWAQADVYRYDDASRQKAWTKIPPASRLPAPTYPDVGICDFQLDPTGGRLFQVLQQRAVGLVLARNEPFEAAGVKLNAAMALEARGLAYVVNGLLDPASTEYWMLPAAYEPAGKSAAVAVKTGPQEAKSLQEFIDVANRGWGPGSTFVITGCINYRGERAPAAR
ncbi:hypothetical protein WMF11_15055 [Sorangium sp. So ce295]|uniref:hypothetical protein n=1 Tax=Sorangium sp. So ce295 TaxID=3133295 RepID=UPI003F5EAC61